MQNPPAFFSIESMKYIVSLGIKHLLVDMPSVDRLFDDGILSAHNIFWETKRKSYLIMLHLKQLLKWFLCLMKWKMVNIC